LEKLRYGWRYVGIGEPAFASKAINRTSDFKQQDWSFGEDNHIQTFKKPIAETPKKEPSARCRAWSDGNHASQVEGRDRSMKLGMEDAIEESSRRL
jgi:hypothetical protein